VPPTPPSPKTAPTPDELRDKLMAIALGPKQASGEMGAYTEHSADDIEKFLQLALGSALPANPHGGATSGWNVLRPARAITQGTY